MSSRHDTAVCPQESPRWPTRDHDRPSTTAGATARQVSAAVSPSLVAIRPTASGPSAPASAAALPGNTATPLLPGRAAYKPACCIGDHEAAALGSAPRMTDL